MGKNSTKQDENIKIEKVSADESVDKITSINDKHTTGEVVMKEAFDCKVYTVY